MSQVDDLFAQLPIGDIAKKLGVSEAEASAAAKQALPALFGGLAVNSNSEAEAEKLQATLSRHEGKLDARLNGDIDEQDGEKIVRHVFGNKSDTVSDKLGQASSASGDLIKKILPILAPIVLSYLANKYLGGGGAAKQSQGGLVDILTGMLGGGSASSRSRSTTNNSDDLLGGLGQVLGGLLGK